MVVVPRNTRSKDKVHSDLNSLAAVTQALQLQGKTVVLSNGVFDLLHVGHLRCLEDARARGDYLIVAVNDDKSTERNKGKRHPIIPCADRMEMLSALWFVDYVIGFGEDTVDELLRTLRPTAYAKGTDYNAKTLPERDTLKELGIKPVFVGGSKEHSTTKLIQRIRRKKF